MDELEEITPDFMAMSDRELLESMAKDAYAVKCMIADAVTQLGPLLSNPKFKLLSKLF